jgi:DNA polymerase-3 subunit alpha (Gram-positive type)
MELVFRYPSHQNKLVQYINSKSSRMAQGKIRQDNLNVLIRNLLFLYIENSSESMYFFRSNQKIVFQDIKVEFEDFIENNPNNYQFPHQFL